MADQQNIFCGNVFPKFDGNVLEVRLEVDTIKPYIYHGQDRNGQPCRFVDVSVKYSRQGNWYVVINDYNARKAAGQGEPQQQRQPGPPPQAPAAPPQRPAPPPFPANPPPPPPPATAQPPTDGPPWPQENNEPPLEDIEF